MSVDGLQALKHRIGIWDGVFHRLATWDTLLSDTANAALAVGFGSPAEFVGSLGDASVVLARYADDTKLAP